MKKNNKSKKDRRSSRENIFLIVLVAALIVLVAVAAVQRFMEKDQVTLVVTEDGHVHTSDGQHVGTVDELFGTPDDAAADAQEEAAPTEGAEAADAQE